MAKRFIPKPEKLQTLFNEFNYNGECPWRKKTILDGIAFETEEIYPNGTIAINTYERGGGWHTYIYVEDALKLVAWCVQNNVPTYIVRNNYDKLEEF